MFFGAGIGHNYRYSKVSMIAELKERDYRPFIFS